MGFARLLRPAWPALVGFGLSVLAFSCKPRDPEAGGLFSEDATTPPASAPASALSLADGEVAPGGQWLVSCKPLDAEADASTYLFEIQGAVSETDDSQVVFVSATRQPPSQHDTGATKQLGHAAVALHGPVFIGYPGGLLTAEAVASATEAGGRTHVGVLTLVSESDVGGLKVGCDVKRKGG